MTQAKRPRKVNLVGRPRKFHEASRPITVTLPDKILASLKLVDKDRAHAIVKATEIAIGAIARQMDNVEVVEVEKGTGIILVGPNNSLKRISWLRLVEVSPSRFLLTIPPGTPVDSLEVGILDLIDHLPPRNSDERDMLVRLWQLMRNLRRRQSISKSEMLFVRTRF